MPQYAFSDIRGRLDDWRLFNNMVESPYYRDAVYEQFSKAEYERRYGKYAGLAQPKLTRTSLRVEIYPDKREMENRGSYVFAKQNLGTLPGLVLAALEGFAS